MGSLHGTGTMLGDPIEVGALCNALQRFYVSREDRPSIVLGAIKSAIAHTESTAGVAGMLMSIMTSQQRQLLPLHFRGLNPYVTSAMRPFEGDIHLPTQTSRGIDGGVTCGASSFGMSGTNAHAVLSGGTNLPGGIGMMEKFHCSRVHPLNFFFMHGFEGCSMLRSQDYSVKLSVGHDLWQHIVHGLPIFPAAGYLDLGIQVLTSLCKISTSSSVVESTSIAQTLPLRHFSDRDIVIQLYDDLNCWRVVGGIDLSRSVYSRGQMGYVIPPSVATPDICTGRSILGGRHYRALGTGGIRSPHLCIEQGLDPCILDSCFHLNVLVAEAGCGSGQNAGSYLPTAVGCFAFTTDHVLIDSLSARSEFKNIAGGDVLCNQDITRPGTQAIMKSMHLKYVKKSNTTNVLKMTETSFTERENCWYRQAWVASRVGCELPTVASDVDDILRGSTFRRCSHFLSSWLNIVQLLSSVTYGVRELNFAARKASMNSPASTDGLGFGSILSTVLQSVGMELFNFVSNSLVFDNPHSRMNGPLKILSVGASSDLDISLSFIGQFLSESHILSESRGINQSETPADDLDPSLFRWAACVTIFSVGLNFRDALIFLGQYPKQTSGYDPGSPGGDCSGVVSKCSDDAHMSPLVGSKVYGLCPSGTGTGGMGKECIVPYFLMSLVPPNVEMCVAASIPTAYITADVVLEHVRLHNNSSLLVHGLGGGVGQAVLSLASSMGCRVIGTSSSTSRRSFLRTKSVQYVFSSSSTFCTDIVSQPLCAEGVVNFLSSNGAVAANLAIISSGGYFIDLGKTGIFSTHAISRERADISRTLLAVGAARSDNPQYHPMPLLSSRMSRLTALLSCGMFESTSLSVYSIHNSQNAFRRMISNRSLGKNVVEKFRCIHSEAMYFLYGGLGGIGTLYTIHQIEQSASNWYWLVEMFTLLF